MLKCTGCGTTDTMEALQAKGYLSCCPERKMLEWMEHPVTPEELARFMSYVDVLPNGCHFWTGARSRGGARNSQRKTKGKRYRNGKGKWYGSFKFRGKTIRAHKFAADYIGKYTPLPKGHHRDHLCVFSLCVNPEHLEHTTAEDNQLRKVERQGAALSADHMAALYHADAPNQAVKWHGLEHPWKELAAAGVWPFDEPDYGAPSDGVLTMGYGC